MIVKVAEALKSQLEDNSDLPFVDKLGGLVKPLTFYNKVEDGTEAKVMPVEVNALTRPCNTNDYNAFLPDTKYMSVIFFEDLGSEPKDEDTYYRYITSSLRIVCWYNLPKINADYTDGELLTMAILEAIPDRIANTSELFQIQTTFAGLTPNTEDVFDAYDLNEAEHQYRQYPYDTAGINFLVDYAIGRDCVSVLMNPKVC